MTVTRHLLVVLGLAALIGVAFANGLRSGMVLDNEFIVQGDPRLRAATWENVGLIFTQDYWYPKGVSRLDRPLTTLSFLVNYTVRANGNAPAGYHVVNLGLHLLNAALVYFLMLTLLMPAWAAPIVAAQFAVHPVVVESVTNIVGRSDLLAGASILGGLLIYIRSTHATGARRAAWLALLALTTTVGVLCKESAAIIAGLLPLYEAAYRVRWTRGNWRRDVATRIRALCLGGWAAVVPVLVVTAWMRARLFDRWALSPDAFLDNPIRGADFLAGRLTAIKVIGKSLWLMLWPLRLSCDYSFDQIPVFSWRLARWEDWKALIALATLAGLVAMAGWALTRRRALFFLLGFLLVALLPTSNLTVLIDSMMAERFLYLPLVGFLGCLVIAVWAMPWPAWARYGLLGALVVGFSVRTIARNADWESNLTLWTSARAVSPRSYRVHRSLAWTLYLQDPKLERDAGAMLDEAEAALAILDPLPPVDSDKLTPLYLGIMARTRADGLSAGGDLNPASQPFYEQAVSALDRARTIDLAQNERHRERELQRGRQLDDVEDVGQPEIYHNLGLSLARLGRHPEALAAFRYMVHLDPGNTIAFRRVADEQRALGRHEEEAVTLVELLLLGDTGPEVGDTALRVYASIADDPVPPFVREGDHYHLNLDSPVVHEHVCAAARDLARIGLESKRRAGADWARQLSVGEHCDMKRFEEVWQQFHGN